MTATPAPGMLLIETEPGALAMANDRVIGPAPRKLPLAASVAEMLQVWPVAVAPVMWTRPALVTVHPALPGAQRERHRARAVRMDGAGDAEVGGAERLAREGIEREGRRRVQHLIGLGRRALLVCRVRQVQLSGRRDQGDLPTEVGVDGRCARAEGHRAERGDTRRVRDDGPAECVGLARTLDREHRRSAGRAPVPWSSLRVAVTPLEAPVTPDVGPARTSEGWAFWIVNELEACDPAFSVSATKAAVTG